MEGDGVISSLVTKREADGDLLVSATELFAMLCCVWDAVVPQPLNRCPQIHFAGLTGGTSITNRPYLGHPDLVTMEPEDEIPRVFDCWSLWLREAGICDSLDDVDLLEMHVFGCQPKSPNPLVDPTGCEWAGWP